MQAYCGGDTGNFAFLPFISRFVPVHRPVSVLDAGANIGTATILLSQMIAFHGEVISVDASPDTTVILKQNTGVLRQRGVVRTVPAAITSHPIAKSGKTVAFAGVRNWHWGFRLVRNESDEAVASGGSNKDEEVEGMAPGSAHVEPRDIVTWHVPTTSLPMLEVRNSCGCKALHEPLLTSA